ncbi:MAG TPA: NYN domain-containing protein [Mycobacteriales bacterium]|nr:NYN domain-containing protein [Mycobacteriales bacterium]
MSTYLLVDGENIDATLGNHMLGGRRPNSEERPRWEKVRSFAAGAWDSDVKGLFFLNASSGNLPMTFVQALMSLDYRPIPLAGTGGEKVVDIGIQRTLDALVGRPGDVLLVSHDGDFLPHITALLDGTRRVGVLGFREYLSSGYSALTDRGLELFDLEDDARCFTVALPRVRIIPLASFDPLLYL